MGKPIAKEAVQQEKEKEVVDLVAWNTLRWCKEKKQKLNCHGIVDGLSTQMNEVTDRGKRVIRRDAIVQQHGLSARQAQAVGYLLENMAFNIEDYEQLCLDTNRRTLQRDIKGLLQKGVLKAEGSARAVRYKLNIEGL